MRSYKAFVLAALVSIAPAVSSANSYFLLTSQTNANTTIDSADSDYFAPADLIAACTSPSCNPQVFTVGYFDVTFAWSLGGGVFSMKTNGATADIVLSLIDATTNTRVAKASASSGSVSNNYSPVNLLFDTPYDLTIGHQYYATLTSDTGTSGSNQYFVKGAIGVTINSTTDGTGTILSNPVPEPSTTVNLLLGAALIGASIRWKRAKSVA